MRYNNYEYNYLEPLDLTCLKIEILKYWNILETF